MRARQLVLTLAVVAVVAPATAAANHATDNTIYDEGTTFLLSRSLAGGVPNGPSRNAAISWDQRRNKLAAFESDATDLVPGDTNAHADVFLVRRAEPIADDGGPWRIGATELVSRGLGGVPANGRSYKPSLDGDAKHLNPHCVAFISDASNLVKGDTNGVADAFVRDLRSNTTTRVSVNSHGRQANAPTLDVSLDGGCTRVAFTTAATNIALTKTSLPNLKRLVTKRPLAGVAQVYVKVLKGDPKDKGLVGETFIASALNGRPGNANSGQPYFAKTGKAVVYSSAATNLHPLDTTSTADIHMRKLDRVFKKYRVRECKRSKCRTTVRGLQTLLLTSQLVSVGPGGTGNGNSTSPSVTDDLLYVAYETLATDLSPVDTNGFSDIMRARMDSSPPKQVLASRIPAGQANGPSSDPVMTASGVAIFFTSDASNLKVLDSFGSDPNGVRDVMVGLPVIESAGVDSLDSQNHYVSGPSENPAPSTRHNYVLIESIDANIDNAIRNPGLQRNIYLRYDGPFTTEGKAE